MTSPNGPRPASPDSSPQRATTLELFFDIVFVFTVTQLTGVLARDMSLLAAGRVLLIFALLWWMYGGYAWLTNARAPTRAAERLLLLGGMAGFLVAGLAIPGAFGSSGTRGPDGVAFGCGYLIVVLVHSGLYLRANRHIWRIIPFNVTSALLVIVAGLVTAPAAYAIWAAAFVVQVVAPVFVRLGGRFDIQPAHFAERHGGLMIVAFGESVVDVGIGASGQRATMSLGLSAALGLALVAALWWAFFGTGEDELAEKVMTGADASRRPGLALAVYFYPYIPMLLGIVATAAGLKHALARPGAPMPAGPALALAGGVALFLAGDLMFRRVLRLGSARYRAAGAVAALACWPVPVAVTADTGIALLTAIVVAVLAVERLSGRDTVNG
ncbi:MAG: low temperature requirement protein A [Nocardiopsaceae bacterium]|nr:low temperature requirement protein A [Nocardiopsaceae bacterium]